LQGFIIILALLALMWLLLIRPQRRRQVEAQKLVNRLEVGKEIVTAGGLYGTITDVGEDEIRVEIADGVEVRLAKRAVAGIVSDDEETEDLEDEEEPDELEAGDESEESGEAEEPAKESAATLPPN
jgi:preprotein translocase subunit YajC